MAFPTSDKAVRLKIYLAEGINTPSTSILPLSVSEKH
jgi:hypothetical protein